MEKIQAAIAKARAARSEKASPDAGRSMKSSMAPAPQVETGPLVLTDPTLTPVDWSTIPSFTPNAARMARNHIVAFKSGPEAAAIDVMRTKLLQQMRANKWRRLAITSPGKDCGKSMLTLNLGFSLARQSNLRILVAEVDLRRPSLAATLGIGEKHSFAKVLEGKERFENHVLRYGENLAFATNHGPSHNSAELLQSPGVGPVLADIEAHYGPDLILFDMPPMLGADDALAFLAHTDCALLVAAAESTSIADVDGCERDLAERSNVLGVVLNKCRYMTRKSDYGYY